MEAERLKACPVSVELTSLLFEEDLVAVLEKGKETFVQRFYPTKLTIFSVTLQSPPNANIFISFSLWYLYQTFLFCLLFTITNMTIYLVEK